MSFTFLTNRDFLLERKLFATLKIDSILNPPNTIIQIPLCIDNSLTYFLNRVNHNNYIAIRPKYNDHSVSVIHHPYVSGQIQTTLVIEEDSNTVYTYKDLRGTPTVFDFQTIYETNLEALNDDPYYMETPLNSIENSEDVSWKIHESGRVSLNYIGLNLTHDIIHKLMLKVMYI